MIFRILLITEHKWYSLNCLSKAHIVSQNTAETITWYCLQPSETIFLVFTHSIFKALGNRKIFWILNHKSKTAHSLFKFSTSVNPDIITAFLKSVKVHHTVLRHGKPVLQKCLVTDIKALRHICKFGNRITKKCKWTVLKSVITCTLSVTFKHSHKFIHGVALSCNLQFKKISGRTNTYGRTYRLPYTNLFESITDIHIHYSLKFRKSWRQKTVKLIITLQNICAGILIWFICEITWKNISCCLFRRIVTERNFILIIETGKCPVTIDKIHSCTYTVI